MKYIQTKDKRIYKVDTNLLKVANKYFFVATERYNSYSRVRPEHEKPDGLPVGTIRSWDSDEITELIDPDVVIEIFKDDQELPRYDYEFGQ